jgi:predicted NAD/FAD-dependent oxidoreductase
MVANMKRNECLVIGSGISGLTMARHLQAAGMKVTVIDKGRGTGGRLATRRISANDQQDGVVDFGAQFFTIKSGEFKDLTGEWFTEGIVREWFDRKPVYPPRHSTRKFPRYIGINGMRRIAKYLGQNLNVIQQQKVVNIKFENLWKVSLEEGTVFDTSNLIITIPVPQALDLLPWDFLSPDKSVRENLQKVDYHRCITVMGILKNESHLSKSGALALEDDKLMWITDNQKKGISPAVPTYTIHCTPAFSLSHWDVPEADIIREISPQAEEYFGSPLSTSRIHRWKFANPNIVFPHPFLMFPEPAPLILAGDGFMEGRIEGAALSAMAAAKALLKHLNY